MRVGTLRVDVNEAGVIEGMTEGKASIVGWRVSVGKGGDTTVGELTIGRLLVGGVTGS